MPVSADFLEELYTQEDKVIMKCCLIAINFIQVPNSIMLHKGFTIVSSPLLQDHSSRIFLYIHIHRVENISMRSAKFTSLTLKIDK